MRLFRVGIPSALVISAVMLLSGYPPTDANSSSESTIKKVENIFEIENSIIIHGLKMDDSGNGGKNAVLKDKGRIIEIDAFEEKPGEVKDNPIKKGTHGKEVGNSVDAGIQAGASYINELRKQDPRWHTTRYTIKKGDNLWDIAQKYNTDSVHIIRINAIDNPGLLSPGKSIIIPHRTGVRHIIRKGDTLSGIALMYNVKLSGILTSNSMKNKQVKLYPGKEIFIPDGRRGDVHNGGKKKHAAYGRRMNDERSITASRFVWPLRGEITSSFGNRIDPFSKKKSFHCGIDISAKPGTPVRASSDGVVIFSGWKEGYGNMVVLRHKGGYITVYAHNKKNVTGKGDNIKKNDIIAYSGMTGAVTGAHLHFEVRKYLTPLNPMRFIKR